MLLEIKKTRRIKDELPRRWFADETMDLIVWHDKHNKILGFQLCYDKPVAEHALSWWHDTGFTHRRVDDGEGKPGSHKGAPILIPDGEFNLNQIADNFKAAAAAIDSKIADFVYRKLTE
ncbi:MAG: hypothetical protein A3J35_01240 [Gammaproteobacteria bacterium RIFCSPLOWO2_02_FULL_52_10]|nr:MAG: hypothetical protein A3J35_01240 [Gammaproteobacteria bacterium RIFCSPLOWO2_02_FULL_52_10]